MHKTHATGSAAELMVAYRFTEANRAVSWPLVVRPYDLLVDGGDKIYRVQVKQGQRTEGKGLRATIKHINGVEDLALNFDYLCLVDTPNEIYVIPSGACECRFRPSELVASLEVRNGRFDAYLNRFNIGVGDTGARTQVQIQAGENMRRLRGQLWSKTQLTDRKVHKRLPLHEAYNIYQLRGTVSAHDLAAQFGVHVMTIQNIFRAKGKRLRRLVEQEDLTDLNKLK